MIRIDDLTAQVASDIPDPAETALLNKAYVYSAPLHRRARADGAEGVCRCHAVNPLRPSATSPCNSRERNGS
jgi:hypothetical protein